MNPPDPSPHPPTDPELTNLVALFLDDRLDAPQRDRLEQRLQLEPAAREYCADQLRFAAALQETLEPQRIEMVETRRVVLEKGSALVEQQRSVRYGDSQPVPLLTTSQRTARSRSALLIALPLLLAAGLTAWHLRKPDAPLPTTAAPPSDPPRLVLRNPNFEASDLSLSARGISDLLVDWSDGVRPAKVELTEIGRSLWLPNAVFRMNSRGWSANGTHGPTPQKSIQPRRGDPFAERITNRSRQPGASAMRLAQAPAPIPYFLEEKAVRNPDMRTLLHAAPLISSHPNLHPARTAMGKRTIHRLTLISLQLPSAAPPSSRPEQSRLPRP